MEITCLMNSKHFDNWNQFLVLIVFFLASRVSIHFSPEGKFENETHFSHQWRHPSLLLHEITSQTLRGVCHYLKRFHHFTGGGDSISESYQEEAWCVRRDIYYGYSPYLTQTFWQGFQVRFYLKQENVFLPLGWFLFRMEALSKRSLYSMAMHSDCMPVAF